MKLLLLNTPSGLKPCYDEDYDEKRKLKLGETYEAEIRLVRNIRLHNMAFALLELAWNYLPGKTQDGFRSKEGFRMYITVAAGYYDVYFNPRLREFVEIPKSWSFKSMDNAEFSEFFERIKDVIWGIISKYVSEEEFNRKLINIMR
ncbi:MAG: DUF1367 family protein [Bacteroidales bacterium]|nr:DUF1367 family protein [Bacteroidales bacterium]